ncbi:peptidoglycan-recognition protein SC2-like protein, partial [Dinothrombium tinctorium]
LCVDKVDPNTNKRGFCIEKHCCKGSIFESTCDSDSQVCCFGSNECRCEYVVNIATNRRGICVSDLFCCKYESVSDERCANEESVCCLTNDICNNDRSPNITDFCLSNYIVSRKDWGARNEKEKLDALPGPIKYAIISHTAMSMCRNTEDCKSQMRSIQNSHMRNFDDIGFNFMIGGNGDIFEGRGWKVKGAHTREAGWNSRSIGIALMGHFEKEQPTNAMLRSTLILLRCGQILGYLTEDYEVLARGYAKCTPDASPGIYAIERIKLWKRFQSNPPKNCSK